ncbi:hypothetical protein F5Y14DRAFT_365458 [Nemania sp. NC0429]|nr:hypothetical protein F5Y14DRAFT_365458 [Nemania sp. NC0429]
MQVITALSVLLSLAEAGLVMKAPRTESQGLPPASGLVMFTLSPTTSTVAESPTSSTMTTTTTTTTTTSFTATATATATVSVANAETTAAPTLDLENASGAKDGKKFIQTTFWACETFPLETHCGWHEPILDASNAGVGMGRAAGQSAARAVFAVAGVIVALVYGF